MTNVFTLEGYPIRLDVADYLQRYDFEGAKWSETKLIARSPFRPDNHPSFYVMLDNGAWGDSGADDREYASGNFAKLVSLLSGLTYEDAVEALVEEFGVREKRLGDRIDLPPITLVESREEPVMDESALADYAHRSDYLEQRGISKTVERLMDIRFHPKHSAIVIPWRDIHGRLAVLKFRRTDRKEFWYRSNGAKVSNLVFGLHKVYERGTKSAVICEAEIDALSWITCGVPAIALGGSNISDIQFELIAKSPLVRLYIAMDNDGPGAKLRSLLESKFRGIIEIVNVEIPAPFKDSNEALQKNINLADLIVDK